MENLDKLDECLSSYKYIKLDYDFKNKLMLIPKQTKKRFSLLHLFPEELIFSVASVVMALFMGGLISFYAFGSSDNVISNDDYFEQVSLVGLIEET